jgi:hypothetical protein
MKLSEAPRGTCLEFDKLKFLSKGNQEFFMAMADKKMSMGNVRDNPEADFDLEVIPKTKFEEAVKASNHDNDWYSLLLAKASLEFPSDKETI